MWKIVSRVRRHLGASELHHRRIAVGFLWLSFFVLIGKLAGAAKEIAVAWRYGVSETVDAYVFVFNLVSWPVAVFLSVLTVVLVPTVAQLRQQNASELHRFRCELLGLTLIVGLGLFILAWLGLPALLRSEWVSLTPTARDEALYISGGMASLIPMGLLAGLFSAWMLTCGHHKNTLFEAIPALTILAALLLPPGWLLVPLLWGTVAGAVLHLAILAALLLKQSDLPAPTFRITSTAWQGFWGSFGIMLGGQMLMSVTGIIDQFLAAGLGPGAISSLSYANRILGLILGMGAMAISRATLPVFSEVVLRHDVNVNTLAVSWAKWLFLLGLGVALAGWIYAPWVVALLFERGAFDPKDTETVANLLRYCLIQVPFYFSGLVLVSALAAQGRHSIIVLSGSLNLLFKTIFAILLVKQFQLTGLVISTVVMYVLSTILLYAFVNKYRRMNFELPQAANR